MAYQSYYGNRKVGFSTMGARRNTYKRPAVPRGNVGPYRPGFQRTRTFNVQRRKTFVSNRPGAYGGGKPGSVGRSLVSKREVLPVLNSVCCH